MIFNPFSILNNQHEEKPGLFYTPFLGRIAQSMFVLNGDMKHLGVLDYLFVLPMITKLLGLKTLTHIISIPKNIVSFALGIIVSPLTAIIHTRFKSKYHAQLQIIKDLDVIVKQKTEDNSRGGKQIKLSELIDLEQENNVNRYIVSYKNNFRDGPHELELYSASACYCWGPLFTGKPHEQSKNRESKQIIKIPVNPSNKAGIQAIYRVGAFFSEDTRAREGNINTLLVVGNNDTSHLIPPI